MSRSLGTAAQTVVGGRAARKGMKGLRTARVDEQVHTDGPHLGHRAGEVAIGDDERSQGHPAIRVEAAKASRRGERTFRPPAGSSG
jgi:hypothetical protein